MKNQRVALVTGAAKGIGAAIADELLKNSYLVLAVDKDEVKSRPNLVFYRADLSINSEVSKIIPGCISEFGRIDVLVNNAAVSLGKDFLSTDLQTWETTVAVNQTAPFFLSQMAAKKMIELGISGRIVNIASVNSVASEMGQSSYVTTKGAIAMMTKSMAVDLAKYKIFVNVIAPGPILTETSAPIFSQSNYVSAIENGVPLKRAGLPAEVADLVIFLASEKATYITGQMIVIDGGFLAYCRMT